MKQIFALVAVALMVVSVGCGGDDATTPTTGTTTEINKVVNTTTLCGKCGQVKGSDSCCKEDATVCDCGFAKGSPACCKVKKSDDGTDIELCGCGQVKGSDSCCKEGATKCDKCGFTKGSPACCKITKPEAKEEEKTEEEKTE